MIVGIGTGLPMLLRSDERRSAWPWLASIAAWTPATAAPKCAEPRPPLKPVADEQRTQQVARTVRNAAALVDNTLRGVSRDDK